MAPRRFVFDAPSRFVTGTVGEPGNRTFFLQARQGRAVLSVALEKVQVALLADRLGTLLEEVRRRGAATDVPAEPAAVEVDSAPLEEPVVPIFRVGTLALAWDGEASALLIEARAETDDDGEAEEIEPFADEERENGPDLLRVRLSSTMAVTFIERALRVLSAGRPPCPLCGLPLNPEGHICPRQNGSMLN